MPDPHDHNISAAGIYYPIKSSGIHRHALRLHSCRTLHIHAHMRMSVQTTAAALTEWLGFIPKCIKGADIQNQPSY